jgi:hypothetical protein
MMPARSDPVVSLTRGQRDALLRACDAAIKQAAQAKGYWAKYRVPVATAIINDLILPRVEGSFELRSLSHEVLITFLEHELMLCLEAQPRKPDLALWDACVSILRDKLGQSLDGSIYERIVCRCEDCEWQRVCWTRLEAKYQAIMATSWSLDVHAERERAFQEYVREYERGPDRAWLKWS